VLPPCERDGDELFHGGVVDDVLQGSVGGEVADDHDALSGPAGREVSQESGHPAYRLAVAFAAGVWLVDVLLEILFDLDRGCAVAVAEVALAQPPVIEDRDVGIAERDLGGLRGAVQV
jgi:hypothetical protein